MKRPMPEWVAPQGVKLTLDIGDRVSYSHEMRKWDEEGQAFEDDPLGSVDVPPIEGRWIGWRRVPVPATAGVVIGARLPWSGQYNYERQVGEDEYQPAYRSRGVTHRTYLVTKSLRAKPVLVLSDDITLTEDSKTT